MTENYSVHALTPNDWREYKAIRLEALQKYPQFFGSSYEKEVQENEARWKYLLAYEEGCLFGLYHGQNLVGVTGLITMREDKEKGLMIASYIKPDYQGKGLSTHLYKARIDWALAFPRWKKLIVGHREGNEASRRANQRHGFTFTHRESQIWPDNTTGDNLYYELDLEQLRQKQ